MEIEISDGGCGILDFLCFDFNCNQIKARATSITTATNTQGHMQPSIPGIAKK
jgi:hypothetical protein